MKPFPEKWLNDCNSDDGKDMQESKKWGRKANGKGNRNKHMYSAQISKIQDSLTVCCGEYRFQICFQKDVNSKPGNGKSKFTTIWIYKKLIAKYREYQAFHADISDPSAKSSCKSAFLNM